MTPDGELTVFAGKFDQSGYVDGPRSEARLYRPTGINADRSRNLYISETDSHTVRKISPDGTVTTIAGRANNAGNADGVGVNAKFFSPTAAVENGGTLFVADARNTALRLGVPVLGWTLVGTPAGPLPTIRIETSNDLRRWAPLTTNTLSDTLIFIDPSANLFPNRFYRAVRVGD